MLVAEQINQAWLESAELADLKAAMRQGGEVLVEVNKLLNTPEGKAVAFEMLNDPDYVPKSKRQPDPEEAAQIEADRKLAEQQAAADAVETPIVTEIPVAGITKAEADVEDAECKELGISIQRDSQNKIVKIIEAYQVTDESGHPIGRPTHLEAKNWAELASKKRSAHENAVRYADRLKRGKSQVAEATARQVLSSKQAEQAQKEADEATELAQKDPTKLKDAISKVAKAERALQAAEKESYTYGETIGNLWLSDHQNDFAVCDANTRLIAEYLKENNLPVSYENLELAFKAKESQIVKPSAPAPSNPAPAAPVPVVAKPVIPAAPAVTEPEVITATPQPSQPAAVAPTPTPVAAPNAQPATRRPGVNGGLQPGAMSAARPTEQRQPTQTTAADLKREIRKMSSAQFRQKLKDPKYASQLEAAGIPLK